MRCCEFTFFDFQAQEIKFLATESYHIGKGELNIVEPILGFKLASKWNVLLCPL